MAQRTGVDLKGKQPDQLAQELFKCTPNQLAAMRAGAFFVLCDEFAEQSDVFKRLTQTNIAVPVEQFVPGWHDMMRRVTHITILSYYWWRISYYV